MNTDLEIAACCGPMSARVNSTGAAGIAAFDFEIPRRDPKTVVRPMAAIPAGPFLMGGDDPDAFPGDGEGPVRQVHVSAFRIDTKAVTNAQFATFVKATGYVTQAEQFGWSFVFHRFVHGQAAQHVMDASVPQAPWWLPVQGAFWRSPEGPGSNVDKRQNHPAVHVSWLDATAYAAWVGKRLPTEAEWEKAARGGLQGARFPWSDDFTVRGHHRCNTWQGTFPRRDSGDDGFVGTAPVNAFRPNGYGLYNTSGNVWEWCDDLFSADWHAVESPATRIDPRGPARAGSCVVARTFATSRTATDTGSPPAP